MTYAVVEFEETFDCEAVPQICLDDEEQTCCWPPYNMGRVATAVKRKEAPKFSWSTYPVKRVFCKVDTYEEAREKCRHYRVISPEVGSKRKRNLAVRCEDREEHAASPQQRRLHTPGAAALPQQTLPGRLRARLPRLLLRQPRSQSRERRPQPWKRSLDQSWVQGGWSQTEPVDRATLQTLLMKQEECLPYLKEMNRSIQELKSRGQTREHPSEDVLDQISLPAFDLE